MELGLWDGSGPPAASVPACMTIAPTVRVPFAFAHAICQFFARHAAAMTQFINYALSFENVWFATVSEVSGAAWPREACGRGPGLAPMPASTPV